MKNLTAPDLKHLVLLGGGHAQVAVLKSFAMKPIEGLRITLISRDVMTPYSGMLPGYLEGAYQADEISIDLSHLAQKAGARFMHGTVSKIDPDAKTITLEDRPPMGYDLLSINTGSAPDLSAINGADTHAIPVKPISTLLGRIAPIFAENMTASRVAIIGGGAAGVEVALSLHHRLNQLDGRDISFSLIQRGVRIMPEFPLKAAKNLEKELKAKDIALHCNADVQAVHADGVSLADGTTLKADLVLVVTAGASPQVIKESGLALDDRGFIAVAPTLKSLSHDDVFAAGDIATVMAHPRPKAGVFAVRAGPILTQNLRQAIFDAPLTQWSPQANYLALVGTGGGKAMPIRGGLVLPPSAWAWRLKEWIDRKFIAKFSDLPPMPPAPQPPLAEFMAKNDPQLDDPALLAMRCLGCGAKTGWSDLDMAIANAASFLSTNGAVPPINISTDSAEFSVKADARLVQSVDAISAIVDDPFLLGRIAALHALSDLFASNAAPHSALAILSLPSSLAHMQKDDITQILAGAMLALHEHGAYLAGGHTAQSQDLQIGFAVTGIANDQQQYQPKDGDMLVLTKPIGVGTIMAGHMKGHAQATGRMRDEAINVMATSNGLAAEIFQQYGHFPMTDVTGFGLGRHCLSLLSTIGDGTASAQFIAEQIPVIEGAESLANDGVVSSLNRKNASAAPIITSADVGLPLSLLHDPQTGGGLLAIVPAEKAAVICAAMADHAYPAAVIGKLHLDGKAQLTMDASW